MSDRAGWHPDVLGPPFEQLTLPLGEDAEGAVVATLVRFARAVPNPLGPARGTDVLYVHGWSDYFFQRELAEFWHGAGARFFALDLRKYGRSLRPGQTPGFISDLSTYDQEIRAALAAMGHPLDGPKRSRRRLILMGHSTGGLTLSLWAARHPGTVAAIVLNSPWLEFQAGFAGRAALSPLIGLHARVDPLGPLPNVDLGFYSRAVSKTLDGAWDYDLLWRPVRGFATHAAWLRAVLAGHAAVAAGLGIDAPVLTMLSARSSIQARWSDEMRRSDSVLVVDDIARRAVQLGPTVTVARFDGALHDILLSDLPVRAAAYDGMRRWIHGYLRSAH